MITWGGPSRLLSGFRRVGSANGFIRQAPPASICACTSNPRRPDADEPGKPATESDPFTLMPILAWKCR